MIFISYSWKDSEKVNPFVNRLKCKGENVWIDYENLDLEKPLERQINKAINRCEKYYLFVSESSMKSDWVKYELMVAVNTKPAENIILVNLVENQMIFKGI